MKKRKYQNEMSQTQVNEKLVLAAVFEFLYVIAALVFSR